MIIFSQVKYYVFSIPNDEEIYVIIQLSKASNHEDDSILFKRWELEDSMTVLQNGRRIIIPNLHVVAVNSFGDGIFVIEDYKTMEVKEHGIDNMITVVLPFATG